MLVHWIEPGSSAWQANSVPLSYWSSNSVCNYLQFICNNTQEFLFNDVTRNICLPSNRGAMYDEHRSDVTGDTFIFLVLYKLHLNIDLKTNERLNFFFLLFQTDHYKSFKASWHVIWRNKSSRKTNILTVRQLII